MAIRGSKPSSAASSPLLLKSDLLPADDDRSGEPFGVSMNITIREFTGVYPYRCEAFRERCCKLSLPSASRAQPDQDRPTSSHTMAGPEGHGPARIAYVDATGLKTEKPMVHLTGLGARKIPS
jgi:hypothetical protein